jgi:hypothetical protein
MSSPQLSSSQSSLSTVPTSSVDSKNNIPFHTYRDMTGQEIYDELHELQTQNIHYAANKNIISLSEFTFNKDLKGDILVPKKRDDESFSEFLLSGIFQIDARNFFMSSDGKWNSNNTLGTRLDQVKPTCHLLPVQRDTDFIRSFEDFPTIVDNLRAIEALGDARKTRDTMSVVVSDPMHSTSAIKLTHHLFIVCFIHSSYSA